jgi:periplasmic protein TonB
MRRPAAALSVAIHSIALLLLFLISVHPAVRKRVTEATHLFMPLRPLSKAGGGGQRQPLPAAKGQAPRAMVHRVFVPPMVVRNEHPKLVAQISLVDVPEVNIQSDVMGDPLGKLGIGSGGPGSNGLGGGKNGGIGDGDGSRVGTNIPAPRTVPVKRSRTPQVIHMEEPEYSEEARKVRFQGTVTLAIDVDTNGRPINIRVLRGAGLGLDEKAIEAVRRWRFRPGISGNQPVVAPAEILVSFRLL